MIKLDADVAVLGSGFGGSLCALILERIGLRPVVIDRAAHPRFAIGESSTPIADMILRDLSERYDLPRLKPLSAYGPWREHYPHLGVGRKRGFSYFYHEPGQAFRPDPEHGNELLVAASSGDYHCDTHWFRADVDAFFADEVRRSGTPLLENTEVEVQQDGNGWVLQGRQKETPVAVSARFIIDATGAGGFLPRTLGLTDASGLPRTHSRALFSHFTGVKRWHDLLEAWGGATSDHPFYCDAAALHHVFDGGWMWMLRFDSDRVSAGFMLDTRRHPLDQSVSPEAEWAGLIRRYPALEEQFSMARLADTPGRLIRTGRMQRRVTRAAGPNWALLPFTAGFVDALHSTGIAHTLSGMERLMGILEQHWGRSTLEEALDGYSASVLGELSMIDTLVGLCYDAGADFRLFSASVLLYFAATVSYEQSRLAGNGEVTTQRFLRADDTHLVSVLDEAYGMLTRLRQEGRPTEENIQAYAQRVEALIEPYNTVGLFHPPSPNMYHHTAARP